MKNGHKTMEKQEIAVNGHNYLSLMKRYNEAEANRQSEFDWVSQDGTTYQFVTRYAHYLLEAMASYLGLKGGNK